MSMNEYGIFEEFLVLYLLTSRYFYCLPVDIIILFETLNV